MAILQRDRAQYSPKAMIPRWVQFDAHRHRDYNDAWAYKVCVRNNAENNGIKVQNKVVVGTGGGSGIGRELVLNLLTIGASVAAVDINESALQVTSGLAGDREVGFDVRVDLA